MQSKETQDALRWLMQPVCKPLTEKERMQFLEANARLSKEYMEKKNKEIADWWAQPVDERVKQAKEGKRLF